MSCPPDCVDPGEFPVASHPSQIEPRVQRVKLDQHPLQPFLETSACKPAGLLHVVCPITWECRWQYMAITWDLQMKDKCVPSIKKGDVFWGAIPLFPEI